MKLIPILFSSAMVQALQAGRKKQTRRAVKLPKWSTGDWDDFTAIDGYVSTICEDTGCEAEISCPYGQPGDVLWVKETFWAWGNWVQAWDSEKGRLAWSFIDITLESDRTYLYKEPEDDLRKKRVHAGPMGWWKRPALFMPYVACRMWLEVTARRAEPLQDITTRDAIDEGISIQDNHCLNYLTGEHDLLKTSLISTGPHTTVPAEVWSYRTLWRSINGPDSWKSNPWVWVVEFKRIDKPND